MDDGAAKRAGSYKDGRNRMVSLFYPANAACGGVTLQGASLLTAHPLVLAVRKNQNCGHRFDSFP